MSALLHLFMPLLNLLVQSGPKQHLSATTVAIPATCMGLAGNNYKWLTVRGLTTKLPDGWFDEPLPPPLLTSKNDANRHYKVCKILPLSDVCC